METYTFNRRVQLIAAYEGAVQNRLLNESSRSTSSDREIPSTQADMSSDAGLGDIISFGKN